MMVVPAAENVPDTFILVDGRCSALCSYTVTVLNALPVCAFGKPFLQPCAGRPLPFYLWKFF